MREWLHETGLRIRALFRRRRLDREMAEELAFHQEMLREKLERDGAAAPDRDVRRAFGDERRWHERLTELWQFQWLENLLRDVMFGLRVLRKSPGFTAVALLTLMLGIGANTAIFSLINALLLRPLPVPKAQELVVLRGGAKDYFLAAPLLRALEKRSDILQNVFAYSMHHFQIETNDSVESVQGCLVSGEYFDALQTPPLLGRYLEADDDRRGGNPSGLAVVISYRFWQSWFHGAPDVVGHRLVLDKVPFTVVGVMPRSFFGVDPVRPSSLYVALAAESLVDAPFNMIDSGFQSSWLNFIGRRKAGISLEQTNVALQTASRSMVEDAARNGKEGTAWLARVEKHGGYTFFAEPGATGFSWLSYQFRQPLWIVFALCGAVLLLACLNLASLLMARATAREREMATRMAIGASRKRLMQQLLVESLLLAGFGAIAGLGLSPIASQALAAMLSHASYAAHIDASLDWRVVLYAVWMALAAALLVGIAPAIQATTGMLNQQLKDNATTFRASRRHRVLPRVLLSGEVALALVVVFGASLLAASLIRLYRAGTGFDPNGILLASLSTIKQPLEGDALIHRYQELGEAYAHIPGVESVSFADVVPMMGSAMMFNVHIPGGKDVGVHTLRTAPGYFHVMRIPVLAGREFRWNDVPSSGMKIVLNQAAVKQLFADGQGLGRHILNGKTDYEVIAIVGNAKYEDLHHEAPPTAFTSITQSGNGGEGIEKLDGTTILRVNGAMAPVTAAVRRVTTEVMPGIPAPVFLSMNSRIDESITSERMMAILAVFFAVCALLVTAIGLYGTLAYTTARRTSEIGIRMALGARRGQVALLVFKENAIVAVIGMVAGLGTALLAARVLASQLYNTSTHDVSVMLLSVLVLGWIACIASLLPALHAARIEPMTAIRCE